MSEDWTLSKVSQRRCESKKCYRSLRFASQLAEECTARAGHLILAYQCYDCGGFHIGRAEPAQLIARKETI